MSLTEKLAVAGAIGFILGAVFCLVLVTVSGR